METKICTHCGEEKPLLEFHKQAKGKYGICSVCKKCVKKRDAINAHIKRKNSIERRKKDPFPSWARGTIRNHKLKGYIINITKEELIDLAMHTTHCKICGCKLKWEAGFGHTSNSPTLDRIYNDSEITINNVWIVCHQCNCMKGDSSMKELMIKCKNILEMYNAIE